MNYSTLMSHLPLRCLASLCATLVGAQLLGQDATLTNYKTGIDTTFSGTAGVDYQEEYFFSDKLMSDRKVVYIKSSTAISLSHNSRNVSYAGSGTYAPVSGGNNGTILYKIDRDLQWGPSWGDGAGNKAFRVFSGGTQSVAQFNNPTYTAPFTFDSLTYDGTTPVVGTTGPMGTITNWGSHYWRGTLDDFGDEWHVLTVADYDPFVADVEGKSSDGKVILFVVNPKTPCLTITVTGNAQFYTTPPKAYFIPKVHKQTTYFSAGSGTISFSLKDINGNNVFYRINGGSWSAGASNPVLTAADFSLGSNTLEYYYAGNAAFTKTRIIVKDPDYPSTGESHGHLLWGNQAEYNAIVARLDREPYKSTFTNFLGNTNLVNPLTQFDTEFATGKRIRYGKFAIGNAFAAKVRGWTTNANGKSKTHALYAKQMLMESERTIDPVGFEINHSLRAIPTRELFYRGYYDMDVTFSLAFAYDLLIANFRANQHAGGITPIEDYFIRDSLAACAFEAMMQEGHYSGQEFPDTGMWGTARNIGGLLVAMAMPSYSTPYYGTSGFDGNTTVYPWTPFPDTPLTWKKVFLDNDAALSGYPNLHHRFGIEEYQINADGHFLDRVPYFDFPLMGHCFALAANLVKMHQPGYSFPHLEAAWIRAVSGTILGLKDPSEGTRRFSTVTMLNQRFPAAAAIGIPWMKSLPNSDNQRESYSLYRAGVYGLVWYNDSAASVTVTAPTSAKVNISVQ